MVYVKKWFAKKKIGFIRIRKKVDNIEEILNLKKQNPKLTKEIKRFATNPRDATNDVDAIKAFVECIKVHPKKKNEILQFAKNKQLSGSHIKELFALMEKEPQKKKDIVQLALENNFSYQAIIHNL
ncbi:MAG: hypothetical protein LBJ74_00985 [Heliobacteriaceae bacterium]|jgi:hypothetical protein|nr:hypothetical protein [Heliobacteriaceae bacterium]